jgi:AP-3 complex subunit delta-1
MIPKFRMAFAESFDLKLVENKDETDLASATESFELQVDEEVDCVAYLELQGNPRKGLSLRGDIHYDVEVNRLN